MRLTVHGVMAATRTTVMGLALLALTLLAADVATGQSTVLTVRDAIRLAEEANPEYARTANDVEFASASRWTAAGLDGFEVSHTREGIPDGGSGFGEQKWSAHTTLPFPLTAIRGWQASKLSTSAMQAARENAFLSLRSAVKDAYTTLLFAQEIVHLRTQDVELAATLVDVVESRVEVGESAQVDLMKVQLQLVTSQNALHDAELQFQNSRYSLFQVIGIDPEDQRYEIQFPDTLAYTPISIEQDDVMAGLEHHPKLDQGVLQTKAARAKAGMMSTSWLPDLRLGYWKQDFGTGYSFSGVEFGMKFGLPGIDRRRTLKEQANIEVNNQELDAFRASLDLKRQAESAWHGYETARDAVIRFSTSQNDRASLLLQRTREGYQLGQLDLLSVLDAQRIYLQVQDEYYRKLRDYYLQLIELERLMDREIVFTDTITDA